MGRPRARQAGVPSIPSPLFHFPSEVRHPLSPLHPTTHEQRRVGGMGGVSAKLPFTQALPCLGPVHNPFMYSWL